MSENVILHIMLLKLERILPLENWRFIEQEGQKLLKAFEHICYFEWSGEYPIEFSATENCITRYNEWRPITTISDTCLIRVICKYVTDYLPLAPDQLLSCLEQKILIIYDDWDVGFSPEEEKRQRLEPDYVGCLSYLEAFKQSERMSQPGKDQRSIQCP